jgi:hypothetical protein
VVFLLFCYFFYVSRRLPRNLFLAYFDLCHLNCFQKALVQRYILHSTHVSKWSRKVVQDVFSAKKCEYIVYPPPTWIRRNFTRVFRIVYITIHTFKLAPADNENKHKSRPCVWISGWILDRSIAHRQLAPICDCLNWTSNHSKIERDHC